jgi:DNA-binding MarR family transcriptional regulator
MRHGQAGHGLDHYRHRDHTSRHQGRQSTFAQDRHENPNITQKRLSQAIGVSPPNLAILLDRLEERGLLARRRNPLDKRSQILSLTPAGARLCARAERTASELEHDATAMLTEAERAQLLGLLQKIFVHAGEPDPDQNAPT